MSFWEQVKALREKRDAEMKAEFEREEERVAKLKAEHQRIAQRLQVLVQAEAIGEISTHCDYCDKKVQYCKKPNVCVKCGKGYDVCATCDNDVCHRCPK